MLTPSPMVIPAIMSRALDSAGQTMTVEHPFSGNPCAQRGFTLIEILVTLFIVAIGLLGLASLMVDGVRNNQSAYLRTQASLLAYDMADRIRVNSAQAESGAYDDFTTVGASKNVPACVSAAAGCPPADLVNVDKAEWTGQIAGADDGIVLLPAGIGVIERDDDVFVIRVSWQETRWDEDVSADAATIEQFAVRFSL